MHRWMTASLLITASAFSGCATPVSKVPEGASATKQNLKQFAYANCLFWHFSSKGYSTDDIRAIAGGYVERGVAPPEAYQEIALFIEGYQPEVSTKQDIDPSLNRCFLLDANGRLDEIIGAYVAP